MDQQSTLNGQVGQVSTPEGRTRHQILMREVNERVRDVIGGVFMTIDLWAAEVERVEFLCECGNDEGCIETLELTAAEYERARSSAASFLTLPGHEILREEDVLEANERFLIVEKSVFGELAIARDRRMR